jgi:hypothetical protein
MSFWFNGEYYIWVLDRGASVVKVSALREGRLATRCMIVDVLVCLWSLEAELVRCNPYYVAVSIVRLSHNKWMLPSSPCAKKPELVRVCISVRFPM